MSKLMIIDGNNIAYRCRYTFQLSHNGEDVSVTYGFLSVLISLLNKITPDSCIVAWDAGIPRYRRETLPSYKANRVKNKDDFDWQEFVRQMNELHELLLPMCGVHTVKFPYVEADDIIYHSTYMAKDLYDEVIVVSADDDMLQVLNIGDNVRIYNHSKKDNNYITKARIEEELGIPIKDFVHWRAMQGDSSDNIAGIRGIGEKTATKLFQTFMSLSGIINAAEKEGTAITPALRKSIKEFGLQGFMTNVKVMALGFDRTGARQKLLESLPNYSPTNVKDLKKYFFSHAFTSFMDGGVYGKFRALTAPTLSSEMRMPVVWPGHFHPVEN